MAVLSLLGQILLFAFETLFLPFHFTQDFRPIPGDGAEGLGIGPSELESFHQPGQKLLPGDGYGDVYKQRTHSDRRAIVVMLYSRYFD